MALKELIKQIFYSDLVYKVYEWGSFQVTKKIIIEARNKSDLKLHLGCGPRLIDDWINIDKRPKRGNSPMRFPQGLRRFENNSVRIIYMSHFLEHLSYPQEASEFIRQCQRILVPGGIVRIVVPGVEKMLKAYVADDREYFKILAKPHPVWCTTKLEPIMYVLQLDGNHKYGYDYVTLEKLLLQEGFRKVVQSDCNQSEKADLRIDYRSRRDEVGEFLSLYVEATK